MSQSIYEELTSKLVQISLLRSCGSVLEWDEQTMMPQNGAEHRANQSSLLAGMVHERSTDPRVGDLLNELEQSGEFSEERPESANIREARRQFDRATKLPRNLVEEISRVSTLAQHAWVEARKQSDFSHFQPWLEKTVSLKREEATAIGFADGGVPYDALLDEYEPGMSTAEVSAVFTPLRAGLVELSEAIRGSGREPDASIITRLYPIDAQRRFSRFAAEKIGFDFNSGRIDEAPHPFCSGFGPGDCRLTTRYDERHFSGAFFGTLHEAGHGMYEQGLDSSHFGTALGVSCSLGIHESQSRMWENFVGRSRAFWDHFYPSAQLEFPEALGETSVDDFHRAVNDVRSSLIRVEADEVTYNLHIMIRFELEQALVTGELTVADVPDRWNQAYRDYLGIDPPNDAEGCLQDIHWSGGMLGYFPTYALGNMYAAQLFNAARRDLGDLDAMFARGDFGPLKGWLNENVHRRGMQYSAGRLVEVVTGEQLSPEPLLAHLKSRFEPLYGLA